MAAVRERNESAWLLPPGPGTNHGLRDDMRRFGDEDEVDIVIVGCGAGRIHPAAAPGPRRLEGRGPGRGPVLGSRSATGSATRRARTTCTGRNRGSSPATIRCRWARTTRAAAWADPWCTTPATRPGSIPATSTPTAPTGWAPTGPSSTRTSALLRGHRRGTAGGRGTLALGRPAPLSAPSASRLRERRAVPARRAGLRHHGEGRARSPSPTAASATGRTASTAASACRAARSTPRPPP